MTDPIFPEPEASDYDEDGKLLASYLAKLDPVESFTGREVAAEENRIRAGWTVRPLKSFIDETYGGDATGEPLDQVVSDLICNLLHLCDAAKLGADATLQKALRTYGEEAMLGGPGVESQPSDMLYVAIDGSYGDARGLRLLPAALVNDEMAEGEIVDLAQQVGVGVTQSAEEPLVTDATLQKALRAYGEETTQAHLTAPVLGPKVEVLHVRDPDGYCAVDVYLDGVVARATEQSIDPGAGRTRSGWNEHLSEVEGDETLSPAFRAATLEALHSWENDPNIDEDE